MTDYKIDPMDITFEPLAGSTFTNFLRLLGQNRFKIGMIGVPRTLYSAVMSFALSPFNLYEKIHCDKEIKKTVIDKPPIFIIGHWRSGTTYLHNLLSQNDQFAYPTTFQTVTPGLFLCFEDLVKPIVASSLPPKRPEDDITIGADLPNEEEYGIGNLSPYSFYNGWCFPKNLDYYYKFVLMDGISQRTIDSWKQVYQYYLRKLTLAHRGKQLVLKNPANTSRVKLLLEMFPDAQFIHIYRNPFHTYLSMMRDIETEMTLYCVQRPSNGSSFETAMVNLYNKMFEKYFQERPRIPNGNLIEVRYEDLVSRPYDEVERIHHALSLPGLRENETRLKQYITSQKSVKTHNYKIDDELKEKIYRYFKTTIDAWGYNGT
jgi:omega-hydroxy-beta-dihydromenaquinone-9 sulfotransferase